MKRRNSPGIITAIHGSTIIKTFLGILALLLFVFSVSGVMTSLRPEYRISSNSVHTVANQFSGKMLFSMLANENHYLFNALPEGKQESIITNQLIKVSTNISLEDPRSLLGRELPGFSIFDNEILVAGEGTNYTNMPYESSPPVDVLNEERDASLQNLDEIKEPDKGVTNQPNQTTNGRKVVEIYHSHNRESYLPYLKGVTDPDLAYHSKINITKLGERMVEDLADKGIGSSLDKTDIMGNLNNKGLNYAKSYQESRKSVQTALANNKDLEYLIDIHRDSKRKKHTTITIRGKEYAKIAFVIGGNNPNYEKNAALANKLHKALEKKYPGISRGVMKQGGSSHNGIYNQDLSGNAMLIEVGGVDNTFEEMYLTVDAFTEVFSEFYWDAKAVDNPTGDSEAR
ncbi:stage II sporulation protein P [Peribacillus frigoritolerans]|jgi:stage II sporulation protein P|uniref:stage II sporulation protein P n=1 Tax=Peribacillus TaxID=2675229 RepID=UPI00054EF512|nr:stage II sporulation protein P [Peribacillus frigoritolerans]KRF49778.1 stage II sporulation protein P [Bacillus sp. Soil745]MDP9740056.1 stage II sporulation protein P [Bacillus sp. B2I3]PAW30154.1 stage II sporulation protein P [Peribacillus simplex]PHD73457.1 stage II sporulation protein P [Bacillus sp. AFS043905]PRS39018.1 stage II sporulation protein P [Bacillus sp. RJGP41]QNK48080.1 stage II sporulation protein P [Brevibacterium sp. PAMC23299]